MQILLADDHQLFREGVALIISEVNAGVDVFEVDTFPKVISTLNEHPSISLVMLDLTMPGGEWREVIETIHATHPDVRIIVLSANDHSEVVREAINLGAHGYVPKTSSGKIMQNAIRLVLDGGTYLPLALLSASENGSETRREGGNSSAINGHHAITARQLEVLQHLKHGRSNKDIARILNISEGTVKLHVTALLRAFNVKNRTQVVMSAQQSNILPSL
jgi:DNA-binding NarL/FixJ family response regulator